MISFMTSRFNGLTNTDYLREKITARPEPVGDLDSIEPNLAAELFGSVLKEIFVPNKFTLEFISEVVGRAAAYSARNFETETQYVNRMYYPPSGEVFPICLTGLAGVGKTETINALRRVMPGPVEIEIDHYQQPHAVYSHWYASARGKASGKQLLMNFLGQEGSTRNNVASLLHTCQQRANQNGISLAVLEEMQHVNTGQGAAKVTDLLLTMSGLNIPMVFVSNYSLIHKLLRRNSEDRQRLLSEPRVMLPDAPDSESWADYISECISASNGRIRANVEDLAREVYRGSFGIKRLAAQLLKLSYIEARSSNRMWISLEDVHRAFLSSAYFSHRDDVEELERQAIQKNKVSRLDLRCPFGIPIRSNVIQFARKDRDNRAAQVVFESSLNATEREIHKKLKQSSYATPTNTKRPQRTSIEKPTDESLLDAFNDFFDPKGD